MTIQTNAQGADRKELVKAISRKLDAPIHYCGAPTFNYEVDCFTVDREGNIHCSDAADPGFVDRITVFLVAEGFSCEEPCYDNPQPEPIMDEDADDFSDTDFVGICISMPRSLFTEQNLANLHNIVESKGGLIKKALSATDLTIEVTDSKVSFPWFPANPTPDEMKAYETFTCKLCDMARNQKRVTAKEKDTENKKYAFRCFLLRLGFIGDEFKSARKILLRNFTGSSAFKSAPKETEVQS